MPHFRQATPLLLLGFVACGGSVASGRADGGGTEAGHVVRSDASSGTVSDARTDASLRDAPARDGSTTRTPDATGDGSLDAAANPLDCLSNTWLPCTFMSDCDGCCVDGTCLPKGASCGEGLGLCTGPSCSGVGALGEPCATGQAFVATGITNDDPTPQCFYEPWTGCTTTSTVCGDAGLCVACGVAGAPCCEFIQIFCADGSYCKDQTTCSTECGQPGEPCCNGATPIECADGGVCLSYGTATPSCTPASACNADAGHCTTCGNPGQACCADGGCEANCEQGICQSPPSMK